jgi:hypothetical protein
MKRDFCTSNSEVLENVGNTQWKFLFYLDQKKIVNSKEADLYLWYLSRKLLFGSKKWHHLLSTSVWVHLSVKFHKKKDFPTYNQ